MTIPIAEQIACVERELRYRERVYPRLVENGRLSINASRLELLRMESVLETLKQVEKGERLI